MTVPLLINVLLAGVWAALRGDFSGPQLLLGFAVGYAVIAVVQPLVASGQYGRRAWYWLELAALVLWDLVLSSLRVAIDVLTPRHRMVPGVIGVPIDLETDLEITVLAGLISITPGTLMLDVSADRRTIFVHAMYIEGRDVEARRREIQHRLERRVGRAFGPHRPDRPSFAVEER